jgi:hypothetical protein
MGANFRCHVRPAQASDRRAGFATYSIGHPAIDAWPKIPHDFVMMDTGERLSVREIQVMFSVENHLPEGVDYYACVAGRWAHYFPARK